MEYIKSKHNDGSLLELDGIAIEYPDWRFSIRTSNTEPLMRLNVEAFDKGIMEEKRDLLMSEIKEKAVEE